MIIYKNKNYNGVLLFVRSNALFSINVSLYKYERIDKLDYPKDWELLDKLLFQ
jgi:hypothetical protein